MLLKIACQHLQYRFGLRQHALTVIIKQQSLQRRLASLANRIGQSIEVNRHSIILQSREFHYPEGSIGRCAIEISLGIDIEVNIALCVTKLKQLILLPFVLFIVLN